MPIPISDKIEPATPGGTVVDDTQVNDTTPGVADSILSEIGIGIIAHP